MHERDDERDERDEPDQSDQHVPVSEEDVATRAELLPEEREGGSEDPTAQARAILEESAERTDDPGGTRDESAQTPGTEPDRDRSAADT